MNLIPSETTRRWSQNFGALFSCTAHMTIQERLSDLYYRTLGLYYRVPSRASLWVFVPPALDVYCVFFSSESSRAPHIGLPGPGPADTSRRVKGYAHVSRKTYAQRHRAWMIDVSILRIQLHTHDTSSRFYRWCHTMFWPRALEEGKSKWPAPPSGCFKRPCCIMESTCDSLSLQ